MANKRGPWDIIPDVSGHEYDEGGISTSPKSTYASWRRRIRYDTLKELIMLLAGLALVLYVFTGESPTTDLLDFVVSGGRPVVKTQSVFIVPAFAGSARIENIRKGAEDNKMSNLFTDVPAPSANGKSPLYRYVGQNSPSVVIVTVVDDVKYPKDYLEKIIENRIDYARAHGYGVFIRYTRDYTNVIEESNNSPSTWARVAIAREALETFPKSVFWFLDQSALIMNPLVDIEKEFLDPAHLEPKMLRGAPIVRTLNYIFTYRANLVNAVSMIMTRDHDGLSSTSFIYRGDFMGKAWLEMWMEPLYRSFSQFSSETEALNHMMQWHTYFLLRTAVVNTKLLNAYANPPDDDLHDELAYTDGDFTATLACDYAAASCKEEFLKFWNGRGQIKS